MTANNGSITLHASGNITTTKVKTTVIAPENIITLATTGLGSIEAGIIHAGD